MLFLLLLLLLFFFFCFAFYVLIYSILPWIWIFNDGCTDTVIIKSFDVRQTNSSNNFVITVIVTFYIGQNI